MSDKAFKLDRQLADTLTKLNQLQKSVAINTNANHVDQNGKIVYHSSLSSSGGVATHSSVNSSNANSNSKTSNLTDKQVIENLIRARERKKSGNSY